MHDKKIGWPAALLPALPMFVLAGIQATRYLKEIGRLKTGLAQTALASANKGATPPVSPPRKAVPREAASARPDEPARQEPSWPAPAIAASSASPPDAPKEEPWLAQFDRAMDREFFRIEERERLCRDPEELKVLGALKASLLELNRVWAELDAGGKSEAEREILIGRSRDLMGMVIRLGTTHRNLRLSQVAHSLGLTDENQITMFISEVDQVFRDTQLDWAGLFSRGW